jgi:1-acyl-sn-glycerol-3-phosphate acyltransferase
VNDGRALTLLRRVVRQVGATWFRAEVRGLDALPPACLLVSNHNFGVWVNPEVWLLGAHVEGLKQLAHDVILRTPLVGRIARACGAIPARHQPALDALSVGHRVAVFPGGGWESCRPSRERDRIDFKGRTGFVRLAREARVPIVPVVTAGGHDGWWVVSRGAGLARALGLTRLRIDVFPLGFAAPFGLLVGPFTPLVPLPRKLILEAGQPMEPMGGTDAEVAARVTGTMQVMLDRLVAELPRSRRRRAG